MACVCFLTIIQVQLTQCLWTDVRLCRIASLPSPPCHLTNTTCHSTDVFSFHTVSREKNIQQSIILPLVRHQELLLGSVKLLLGIKSFRSLFSKGQILFFLPIFSHYCVHLVYLAGLSTLIRLTNHWHATLHRVHYALLQRPQTTARTPGSFQDFGLKFVLFGLLFFCCCYHTNIWGSINLKEQRPAE